MIAVIFRPAAAADVEDAYVWYESRRPGLGDEFLEAVHVASQGIADNPFRYPVVYRDTRRLLLRRFPYGVFFRVIDDQPVVVACMHASRQPRRWETWR